MAAALVFLSAAVLFPTATQADRPLLTGSEMPPVMHPDPAAGRPVADEEPGPAAPRSFTKTTREVIEDLVPAGQRAEDISRRSETSKHFPRPDGAITGLFFTAPVHYRDAQGRWQDIDTAITASSDPAYDYMNVTHSFEMYFRKDLMDERGTVKVQKDGAWVEMKSATALRLKDGAWRKDGDPVVRKNLADLKPRHFIEKLWRRARKVDGAKNKLSYPRLYDEGGKTIAVDYTVLGDRLHEEFVLNRPLGLPEISQELALHQAYAKAQGKAIGIYHEKTHEVLWVMPRPVMYEIGTEDPRTGIRQESHGLHYEIKPNDGLPLERSRRLTVTKVFDPEGRDWLLDPRRHYPLAVDADFAPPTDGGTNEGQDAGSMALARATGEDWLGPGEYYVGRHKTASPMYYTDRSFLAFDTSSIPDLTTYVVSQVNLYAVLQNDWSTTDTDIRTTKHDFSVQGGWQTEGAYDNVPLASLDTDWLYTTSGKSAGTAYTSDNMSTAWVVKGGTTRYALLTGKDDANSTFSSSSPDEYIRMSSPVLKVLYYIKGTWDGGGTGAYWTEAANWAGDSLPTSTTDVIFDATSTKNSAMNATFVDPIGDLTIDSGYTGTLTADDSFIGDSFTQHSGTFIQSSSIISFRGDFTHTGGTFTAGIGSTQEIRMMGYSRTITSGGAVFNTLRIGKTGFSDGSGSVSISTNDDLRVARALNSSSYTTTSFDISNDTVYISGNGVSYAADFGAFDTLITTGSTLVFDAEGGVQRFDPHANFSFNNITHSGAGTLEIGNNNLNVDGNFIHSAGALALVTLSSHSILFGGDWTGGGTMSVEAAGHKFNFDGVGGSPQTIRSNNTWPNLYISGLGRTIYFESAKTQTIAASGVLNWVANTGNTITLAPLTAATHWLLNVDATATQTVTRISVSYCDASGGAAINAPTGSGNVNGGNNVNWVFDGQTHAAPTLSSPANGGGGVSTSPTLSWNAVSGATSYTYQVATDAGFVNKVYNTSTAGTSFAASLSQTTTYYWRVYASNTGGSSTWSSVWSFITTVPPAPAAPTLSSPADLATGVALNPTLSWNASSGATSYGLQVATDAGFTSLVYNTTGIAATSYQLSSPTLTGSTTYYWKVNATNANGTSGWSTSRSFTTGAVPAVPTLSSPADLATNVALNPTLSWNASSGATSYGVQVATDVGFGNLVYNTTGIAATSYQLSSPTLSGSTAYYWKVNATNAGGTSGWSTSRSFTTILAGIWDGGGSTNNWSEAANWSIDTLPTGTQAVTFDSTSTKSCTIDALGTWSGGNFSLSSGYTGTVTAGADFTAANFTQAAGTFNGGSATVTLTGNFSKTGGTFTPATSTFVFTGASKSITSGGAAFNNLQIGDASSGASISTADTLDVNGNFSVGNGAATTFDISNDTVNFAGNVDLTNLDTFTVTGSTAVFDAASGTQTLNSASQGFNDVTHSGAGTLQLLAIIPLLRNFVNSAGVLDINSRFLFVIGDWTGGGTISGTTGYVWFASNSTTQTIRSDNTWPAIHITGDSKTVYFESGKTQTVAANGGWYLSANSGNTITLAPLTAATPWLLNVNASATQTVSRISASYSNASGGAEINASDGTNTNGGNNTNWNFVAPSVWDGGGATNNWSEAANWSNNTLPTGTIPVVFNATSTKSCTIDGLTSWTGGNLSLNSGYTGTVTAGGESFNVVNFTLAAGTFNGGSVNVTVSGNFSKTGGTFTPASSTFVFTGASKSITSGGAAFNNLKIGNPSLGASISTADALDVNGTFSVGEGGTTTFDISNDTVNFAGNVDLTNLDTFTVTGSTAVFDAASGTQTLNSAGKWFNNVTHSGAGTLQLSAALYVNGNFINSAGVLDTTDGGNAVSVAGDWTGGGTVSGVGGFWFVGSSNQTIRSDNTWRILYLTGVSRTIYFESAKTQTISTSGGLHWVADEGNTITLAPLTAATPWLLNVGASASQRVTHISVSYSDASAGAAINSINGTNGGNNTNWNFVTASLWDGGGATNNWSEAANWNNDTLPTGTITVAFNGTSVKNCTIDALGTWSGGNLSLYSGYTGTVTAGANFTAASFTLAAGTFSGGSATVTLSGNFTKTGGTFTPATSTFIFAGASNAITSGGAAFNHFQIGSATAGGSVSPADTLDINGNFSAGSSGSTVFNISNDTVNFAGNVDFTNLDTFTVTGSTVVFDAASGTQTLNSTGPTRPFQNVTHSGAGTLQLTDDLDVNGNFVNSAGVLDINTRVLTIGGDWTGGGTISVTTGRPEFDGSGNQTIRGDNTWTKLYLTGVSRTVYFESAKTQTVSASGVLYLSGDSLNLITLAPLTAVTPWLLNVSASATQTVLRISVSYSDASGGAEINATSTSNTNGGNNTNWSFSTDKMWDGGGTTNNWSEAANWNNNTLPSGTMGIIFDATSTKSCTIDALGTWSGGNLSLNSGYTGTVTAGANFTASNFTQAAGTFDGGSATVTLTGDFMKYVAGTFTAASSTFVFTGASKTITSTGAVFNNLQIGNATSGASINTAANTMDVNGNFSVGNGAATTFDIGSGTVKFAGNVDLTNLDTFTVTGSTAVFDAVSGTQTLNSAGKSFNNLTHSGASTLQLTGDLVLGATGDFIHSAGVLDIGNYTLSLGGDWTGGGTISGTGQIQFNGPVTQTIRSDNTWPNLYISGSGRTIYFESAKTQTIAAGGVLSLVSDSTTTLAPLTAATPWLLNVNASATQTVTRISVSYCDAFAGAAINATDGTNTDGGNNGNWSFVTDTGGGFLQFF